MGEYAKIIKVSSEKELNELLTIGWELITEEKKSSIIYDFGQSAVSESVSYIIGVTHKTIAENLSKIINLYESFGLKEKLYEKIEEENNDNLELYDFEDDYFERRCEKNKLTKTISHYEYWTSDMSEIKKMYLKPEKK